MLLKIKETGIHKRFKCIAQVHKHLSGRHSIGTKKSDDEGLIRMLAVRKKNIINWKNILKVEATAVTATSYHH